MRILLFALFMTLSVCVSAQGFFGSVPKPKSLAGIKRGAAISANVAAAAETQKWQFRPVTNIASYIIGKDVKESSIITGAGVGYEYLKYNASTEKWNIVVSINALMYGRIALGNESNGKKMLTGISLGAFDNLIMIGYATDFSNSYGTLGIGIPLNNL